MEEDFLSKVVVDMCSRSFLLISENGTQRLVECDTPDEFLNVLQVCNELEGEKIEYAQLSEKK
jgi:hypothetical protein|tara:strand:- start:277 stop:465 length:189 start_codon:yes stop_codon:yes gene_type:complete